MDINAPPTSPSPSHPLASILDALGLGPLQPKDITPTQILQLKELLYAFEQETSSSAEVCPHSSSAGWEAVSV